MLIERHNAILELARQMGRVSVDDLARRFDVSPQTIRKDLNELCDRRLLARTHGGALLSSGIENVGYEARRIISSREKADIGEKVASLIPDNASIFINIGTTTEAVAQALLQHRGLMVITNNINVASLMRGYSQIEVVIAGGVLRHSDGGIVGEATLDFIKQFRLDFGILGISGIDLDGSLLDFDYHEVRVKQAIIENSRSVFLAVDHSKFGRNAMVKLGNIAQIHTLFTDQAPPAEIQAILHEHQIPMEVAAER